VNLQALNQSLPSLLRSCVCSCAGTGLLFNDAGVTGIKTGTPGTGEESLVAAAGSGIMLPSAVYTMKPDQRAALRGYALMCLVLSGKPVDMAR